MKKKKDSTKYIWYAVAIGVIVLFLLILLSSILSLGERLEHIRFGVVKLSYVFYVLAFFLLYFLIIRPVGIILFSPSFSVETTLDKNSKKNYRVYKKVAKRLIELDHIPDEAKANLKENMGNYPVLKDNLNYAFNHHIKKQINKRIRQHAKTVMISTAIIQNGRMDFISVAVVNVRMIKELVVMCGFRPSMKNLSKLTVNVFTTALIAEGLENLDIADILPNSTMNILGDIPLIKPILSSVLQGISNALLTLRIGIVTRKYLFSDAKEITKESIRKGALLEAAKMLPGVIADALVILPKSIGRFFKKKPATDEENNE